MRKRNFADIRMRKLGKRISGVYTQAQKELTEKVNSFFANFEKMDAQKKALVDAKKLTEKEYKAWRKNKMLMGEKYMDLRDTMADRMFHANEIASRYMNGELPAVYAHNFNEVGKDVKKQIKGFSFDLVNENTVRNLSTKNKTLLPYKFVDGRRDIRWNTRRVNSAMLQGIIQGESIPKIAQRLMNVTEMNKESAIRNARTALTGAQNKGRNDAMEEIAEKGIELRKEWVAVTGDGRTREAHMELHGVQEKIDEPFENSIGRIMYPGDPNADPANVYNCRCAIRSVVVGITKSIKGTEEGLH